MRRERCCGGSGRCLCAAAFGLGLILSCFCPAGLVLFIAGVIIVALGIALVRR